MAHRIVWSSRAAQDLDSITEYIAADSPAYAGVVLKNIVNQQSLSHPHQVAGMRFDHDPDALAGAELESVARR